MAIKEISTTGSDGASGNPGTPWATLEHALENVSPGDTIDFRTGTYDQLINDGSQFVPSGVEGAPITIQGHVGETVILRPTNTPRIVTLGSACSYLNFSRLIMDGVNQQSLFSDGIGLGPDAHHVNFLNCSILNTWQNGILTDGSYNQFVDCLVQDTGLNPVPSVAFHGLYIIGNNNLMLRVTVLNSQGWGIHIYSQFGAPNNNLAAYCRIKNFGIGRSANGIILSRGNNNRAIRNLIYDGNGDGLHMGYGGAQQQALYNTVYNCTGAGVSIGRAEGVTAIGNILINNGSGAFTDTGEGSGRTYSKNFSDTPGLGVEFVGDPLFNNVGAEDFTLQATSPAINAGVPVNDVSYNGPAPDLGAEEFGSATLPDVSIIITPNPIPPGDSGTIIWESDGDTVDIPGVGVDLPPSGTATLPVGQNLVSVQAYNINGSSLVQQSVGQFLAGLLYRATVGYMPRSIKAGADLSVDNLEIEGLMIDKVRALAQGLLIQGLSNEDLQVGRFDHARAEIFFVNYDNPESRLILPGSGNIGQMKMKRGTYVAELRGLTIYLQQTIGDLYSKICRAQVGDDITDYRVAGFGCKVRLDPPFWLPLSDYTVRPLYDASKGSVVKPDIYNGRHFRCSVAGTSDNTEPAWNLTIGGTTVDGTCEWITEQALTVFGSVTQAWNKRFFKDAARNEPAVTGLGVNTGTAQYAIRALDQGDKWFEVDGDIASYFTSGTTFTINGSIGNDGTYTTTIASFTGDRTRITVSEAMPDEEISGAITAPLTIPTGFFSYGKLTFLTGLNKGISKEVQDFKLAKYPIIDVDDGAKLFMVEGDQTDFFSVGQQFPVTNSTGNDGSYDIVSVTYNIGDDVTEIEVAQTIADATVDGDILSGPGDFELFERMPFNIVVGDEYVVSAGCDWSKEMCKRKFDNIRNRRAEDEIPGMDIANLSPDRPTA